MGHARQGRPYQLDADGDSATEKDRKTIATINQQLFAKGEGKVVSKPLWSGFQNAGVHDLEPESGIVLRAGSTGKRWSPQTPFS